jgi:predicted ferric reductase
MNVYESRGMNVYESESLLSSEKSTIGRQIKYGKQYLFAFVCSMTLIGSIVFACMILPPLWNRPLFDYLRSSDVDNSIINTFLWKVGKKPSEEETKNGWVYPMIVPKLFLNDIVFFSLVSLFLCIGLISASFRNCHLMLRSQLYFGLNVGETFFYFLIVSLFLFESWYWVFAGSQRIMITALEESIAVSTLGGVYSSSAGFFAFHGAAARISGHLASLAVSLTLLPAPKTSLLDDAFAVSTQSAIVIHKRLGMLSYALTTSHFSLWLIKWFHEDNLFYNMFAVSRLKVSPSPLLDESTAGEHTDNFTIPLVECAWLLLTVSLIIGVFLRNFPRWYSAFQVVHPLAVGFFLLSALIHSWGFWKYSVLGLLLILFEKIIRAIRTSTNIATVNTIKTSNGITYLVLNVCDFSFECGQYLFLSIYSKDGSFITRSLRSIERHPFSIASSPSKAQFGTVSFIIRDRNHFLLNNVKSWTSHVALLANLDYNNVYFTLDGPYGSVFPYRDFESILLVVGGVGVSSIIGLVEELLFHQQNEEDLGRLHHIDLIWSTKSSTCAGLLSAVSKTLQEAKRSTLFRLHLYISDSGSSYLSDMDNSLFSEIRGRPKLDKFFKLVGREGCAAAFVVGPINMIQESNMLGKIHNVSVYSNAWE